MSKKLQKYDRRYPNFYYFQWVTEYRGIVFKNLAVYSSHMKLIRLVASRDGSHTDEDFIENFLSYRSPISYNLIKLKDDWIP